MFAYRAEAGRVRVAFTDRHGGHSEGPYASLNLASHTPQDPRAHENVLTVAAAFGGGSRVRSVVVMHQVHGADVQRVDEAMFADPVNAEGGPAHEQDPPISAPVDPVDGLVTALRGVVLLVRVADCVPVLLADPVAGVVGAAHAGRPGLVAGVVPATVAAMRDLGARNITAWLGPHVCGRCYEVPAALRDEVAAIVPGTGAETSWGTPSLDLGVGVRDQLRAEGVEATDTGPCTLEDPGSFSYRRQGSASGRLGGLVWIRP